MLTKIPKIPFFRAANCQKGFTFVELAIIIVILGLLATIATPLYQDLQTEAKRNSLRSSLYSLRESINSWASQKAVSGPGFTWPSIDTLRSTGMVVMHDIPENPFQQKANAPDSIVTGATKGVVVGTRGGWAYNPTTGEIWPNTSSQVPGAGCTGTEPLNENLW